MPVKTFSGSYANVWDSVISYLEKEKEPIIVADKKKGTISTDWVNMHKVFSVKRYHYEIQINKVGEDQVQVGIVSPQESYTMDDWEEILPHERRARRIFQFIKSNIKAMQNKVGRVTSRPFNKRGKRLMRSNP